MHAAFLSSNDPAWVDAEVVLAGDPGARVAAQVGIWLSSGQTLRVDVQLAGAECHFAENVRCVAGVAYVGYGERLFVVLPECKSVRTHSLSGYFGYLYSVEDLQVPQESFAVLVASASELLSFSINGDLLWHVANLGIDGVVVQTVGEDVIRGEGEWDPPGGWRSFSLSIATGKHVT
jgi:hypothetical protein